MTGECNTDRNIGMYKSRMIALFLQFKHPHTLWGIKAVSTQVDLIMSSVKLGIEEVFKLLAHVIHKKSDKLYPSYSVNNFTNPLESLGF